jgi:hypothetical protein
VQKMFPNSYANRRKTYDYEEQDVASLPPAGYLWTNAAAAGLTIRNFGYMTVSTAASTWATRTWTAPRFS